MDNIGVLQKFIEAHDLRNSHSQAIFNALVSIETENRKLKSVPMEIHITLTGYDSGIVTMLGHNLNNNFFPTDFRAKYQNFTHDNQCLLIDGIHKQNLEIGKYNVKIQALNRTKD